MIKTYKDLQNEKMRLILISEEKKGLIKEEFAVIRESMQPAADALSVIGKLTSRDKSNPLLNFGVDFVVDTFFKRMLLRKIGWLPRIVVPYLLKNFGSNILEENSGLGFLKKINFKNFFAKTKKQ